MRNSAFECSGARELRIEHGRRDFRWQSTVLDVEFRFRFRHPVLDDLAGFCRRCRKAAYSERKRGAASTRGVAAVNLNSNSKADNNNLNPRRTIRSVLDLSRWEGEGVGRRPEYDASSAYHTWDPAADPDACGVCERELWPLPRVRRPLRGVSPSAGRVWPLPPVRRTEKLLGESSVVPPGAPRGTVPRGAAAREDERFSEAAPSLRREQRALGDRPLGGPLGRGPFGEEDDDPLLPEEPFRVSLVKHQKHELFSAPLDMTISPLSAWVSDPFLRRYIREWGHVCILPRRYLKKSLQDKCYGSLAGEPSLLSTGASSGNLTYLAHMRRSGKTSPLLYLAGWRRALLLQTELFSHAPEQCTPQGVWLARAMRLKWRIWRDREGWPNLFDGG